MSQNSEIGRGRKCISRNGPPSIHRTAIGATIIALCTEDDVDQAISLLGNVNTYSVVNAFINLKIDVECATGKD